MRPSEAIRLGAMLKPQGFGATHSIRPVRWFDKLFTKPTPVSCALGALDDALGNPRETKIAEHLGMAFRGVSDGKIGELTTYAKWPDEFDAVLYRFATCPACHALRTEVVRVIPHLNDFHRWTREHIADWLEAIENRREVQAPAETTTTQTL